MDILARDIFGMRGPLCAQRAPHKKARRHLRVRVQGDAQIKWRLAPQRIAPRGLMAKLYQKDPVDDGHGRKRFLPQRRAALRVMIEAKRHRECAVDSALRAKKLPLINQWRGGWRGLYVDGRLQPQACNQSKRAPQRRFHILRSVRIPTTPTLRSTPGAPDCI